MEAASVAWHHLGWKPVFVSEVEPFANAVLANHYPAVPNLGDFTRIGRDVHAPGPTDLLVGGTPCQAFSVAGKRAGLDDPRGNLTLEFLGLVDRLRPRWVVWENVPGVLSIDGGRTFGAFLRYLGEFGYGTAYAVLDAQFFGVPQRRRRVFVVGCLGDWRAAAAVLLDPEGLRGDPAPRRPSREGAARGAEEGAGGGGLEAVAETLRAGGGRGPSHHKVNGTDRATLIPDTSGTLGGGGERGWSNDLDRSGAFIPEVAPTLNAGGNETGGHRFPGTTVDTSEGLIAHTLRADGFDASEDGTGRGTPLVAATLTGGSGPRGHRGDDGTDTHVVEVAATVRTVSRACPHPDGQTLIPEVAGCLQERDGKGSDSDTKPGHLIPCLRAGNPYNNSDPGMEAQMLVAQPYRVHAEHSTAMTGDGDARVADPVDVARCLDQTGGYATNQGGTVVADVLPFDTTNVTSAANSSDPRPGDPCHTLAAGAHPPAVALEAEIHAFQANQGTQVKSDGGGPTLTANAPTAIAFAQNCREEVRELGVAGALGAEPGTHQRTYLADAAPTLTAANDPSRSPQSEEVQRQVASVHSATMAVRRLTPRECERLQGFPDDYTRVAVTMVRHGAKCRAYPGGRDPESPDEPIVDIVPHGTERAACGCKARFRSADKCPDGPRYRVMGNSMAVPVMRWIGERIAHVDALLRAR